MRAIATLVGAVLLALPAYVPGYAQTPRPAAPTTTTTPPVPAAPAPSLTTRPATAAGTATPVPAPAATGAGSKVDINAATTAQLDALPGIGPARSAAIIAARPYTDLKELVSKKVLSQSVFDGAKSRMALANINTSTEAELAKTLPGIGDVRAKAIVAGRPYATPQDLVAKKVLTQAQFDKIKDLVAY